MTTNKDAIVFRLHEDSLIATRHIAADHCVEVALHDPNVKKDYELLRDRASAFDRIVSIVGNRLEARGLTTEEAVSKAFARCVQTQGFEVLEERLKSLQLAHEELIKENARLREQPANNAEQPANTSERIVPCVLERELTQLLNSQGKDSDLRIPDFVLARFFRIMLFELQQLIYAHDNDRRRG